MIHDEQRRILLILPSQLLEQADEAAENLMISRAGFIRQAIAKNVTAFHRNDKELVCVPKDRSV